MKIFIGESSYIIRKGIIQLLSQFKEVDIIKEFSTSDELEKALLESSPNILIINTAFNHEDIETAISESEHQPVILHLFNTQLPHDSTKTHLSVFENKATLTEKIENAIYISNENENINDSEELSPREKLVLKHVALGQTNKEIAEKLFISTHTVISHRKNITRKLNIKTVSGLTVYAILNKIIGIDDIN